MNAVKTVQEMYDAYPYPSIAYFNPKIDVMQHANKVLQSLGKTVEEFGEGTTILDVGCGTGEITCSLASHGARVIGIDVCKNSLERAKLLAEKNNLKNIEFIQADLFELGLGEKFDYVFSFGVLHHTLEPRKGFLKLVEHLKPKGFLTIGLYDWLGRLRHRLRRAVVSLKAGGNLEKRIEVANQLFCKGKADKSEKIYLADKYAHPLETYSSLNQVRSWFKENQIRFLACNPELKTFISNQFLNNLANESQWFLQEKTFFIVSGQRIK